ncbi:MAG TPA: hypothetical protein PK286_02245 [Devosia sp.]|nr:hypothetical protein [Devosia sp.]
MAVGLLSAFLSGLVAFFIARAIARNAASLGLVQNPNERSSHKAPTPSGGGVGIVAGGLVAAVPLALEIAWPTLAVLGLSLVVAAIGFIDDRRHIPAPLRLAAQLIITGILIGIAPLDAVAAQLSQHLPFLLVAALFILAAVYWLNLFNFMDGIDGLAASQAAFMLIAAALIAATSNGMSTETPLLWWMVGVSGAALGFLLLNWAPAKIFMGDAGSTWLGFIIAALCLWTISLGWLSLWQWLILGALFITDATLTLVRRTLRGENPLKAHRLHAYQHLSRRWGGHGRVTLLYVAVNVVLLLPLAWAAGLLPGVALGATIAAYVPLVAGLLWAGAGEREAVA